MLCDVYGFEPLVVWRLELVMVFIDNTRLWRVAVVVGSFMLLLTVALPSQTAVAAGPEPTAGALTSSSSDYVSLSPSRLLDTRVGNGAPVGVVGAQGVVELQVTGRGGVPASGVGAVVLNVTVTEPSAASFVTVYPSGTKRPLASNLNMVAGQVTPNLVIAKVGAGGKVSLFNNSGTTHLVADVMGWFRGGASYTSLSPSRLLDTRVGNGAPVGVVGAQGVVELQVTGRGGVPASGVGAVVLNVTVTEPSAASFVTVYPSGTKRPLASNLNMVAGQVTPNLVIAKVGAGGKVSLFNNSGTTHLVADVMGWFRGSSSVAPPVRGVVQLDAGDQHTCAVLNDGGVNCWGKNSYGQLGDGTTADNNLAVAVVGLSNAVAVDAGDFHTCAILRGGGVRCWGRNEEGRLGDGTRTNRNLPVAVVGMTNAVAVSAGDFHSCALRGDGRVKCWGKNSAGQLGDGTVKDRTSAVRVVGLSNASSVAVGENHTCAALQNGKARCWGNNGSGRLGNGSTTNSKTPVPVSGVSNAVSLSAGDFHNCVALGDGRVKCWGLNSDGQLGDGTLSTRTSPVLAFGVSNATLVAAGENHACALLANGAEKCWGLNSYGQLGDGTTVLRTKPVGVAGVSKAVAVTGGGDHSCALLPSGRVSCWGRNIAGQLGDGTNVSRSTPALVS